MIASGTILFSSWCARGTSVAKPLDDGVLHRLLGEQESRVVQLSKSVEDDRTRSARVLAKSLIREIRASGHGVGYVIVVASELIGLATRSAQHGE